MTKSSPSTNLDILRAIAVLAVYADHLLYYCLGISHVGTFTMVQLGRCGVLIFFVHTCLVLLLSLSRQKQDRASLFGGFYVRRLFRIYPLSILCVAVVVWMHVPLVPNVTYQHVGAGTVVSNLLLMQNLTGVPSLSGPLWSLPFEVQMYISLPFVYLLSVRITSLVLPACLWTAVVTLNIIFVRRWPFGASLIEFIPCFLGGLIAYQLYSREGWKAPGWSWPLGILAVIAVYAYLNNCLPVGRQLLSEWLVCVGLGLSIPFFHDITPAWPVRACHLVAKYSYGIYLAHLPIMWLVFTRLESFTPLIKCSLLISLSVLVPVAAYHILEDPAMRKGIALAEKLCPEAKKSCIQSRRSKLTYHDVA